MTRAPGQPRAAELHLTRRDAEEALRGGLEPEDLLDGLRASSGSRRCSRSAAASKNVRRQRAADGARDGDVAGDHQVEGEAGDLHRGERLVRLLVGRDHRAQEVVGRPPPTILHRCDAVALQQDEARARARPARRRGAPAGAAASRCPSDGSARGRPAGSRTARRAPAVGAARRRRRPGRRFPSARARRGASSRWPRCAAPAR